ncbi:MULTISPECIES: hypothetical protein [unclassified Rhizobium]|uniref:hypothetical protein n=1 Tax=unclassified Rhizobium TaxID=2613769 RepID=UPI003D2DF591
MSYSPNDRGPDIPPTRGRTRSTGLWVGLAALLLIGGFVWMQAGTSPTDPTTTSSTTDTTTPAVPAAPQNNMAPQTGNGTTQPSTATPSQP